MEEKGAVRKEERTNKWLNELRRGERREEWIKEGGEKKEGSKEVKEGRRGWRKGKKEERRKGERKKAGIVVKGTRRDERTGGLRNEQFYKYIKIDMRVNQGKYFSIYVTMFDLNPPKKE